ncbi:MAG: hypothetical protein H6925_00305 [Holosporaceae bacterium]|nr:MAG: hypothetical protein H6925_00305 [Holosporaceae bacterium]
MTFAIAESKPGLRMGSGPDDLKLVTHHDKQALFLFGRQHQPIDQLR